MTPKRPAWFTDAAPAQATALQALARLLARQAALEHVRAAHAGKQDGPARQSPPGRAR